MHLEDLTQDELLRWIDGRDIEVQTMRAWKEGKLFLHIFRHHIIIFADIIWAITMAGKSERPSKDLQDIIANVSGILLSILVLIKPLAPQIKTHYQGRLAAYEGCLAALIFTIHSYDLGGWSVERTPMFFYPKK